LVGRPLASPYSKWGLLALVPRPPTTQQHTASIVVTIAIWPRRIHSGYVAGVNFSSTLSTPSSPPCCLPLTIQWYTAITTTPLRLDDLRHAMSNQFPSSINPAQLNPAVLQAFAAAQQASGGQLGSGNPNAVQAFNTFHSAFRKLQSAESQRLDQERLGISMPPQQQQQSQQSGLQGMSQQQFLQMMQQAGMMQPNGNTGVTGVGGGGNDQSSMMAYSMSGQQGMNGMNGTTGVNGMNNGGYGNMGMANMPNVAASMGGNMANMNNSNMPNMAMGNAAAANAFNIHSSQQGLNLPGMPENEQGRRQMLQK